MNRWLPDTNVWILLLKQPPVILRQRLEARSAQDIVVCSIVKAELWHGAQKYGNSLQRQTTKDTLLTSYVSLAFDDTAAKHYAEIRHQLEIQGQMVGPNDLKIAAICRAHGVRLVTTNTGEFGRIASLQVEDWTKP